MRDKPTSEVRAQSKKTVALVLVTAALAVFVTGTQQILAAGPYSGDLYVSLTGNDTTGTGTQANPWKTIGKAVTELETDGVNGAVTVKIDSTGVFTEDIEVNAISGTSATNTVTFQPESGKFPTIENSTAGTEAIKLSGCTFVTLKDLDISTPTGGHGIVITGSSTTDNTVDGCDVHDVTGGGKDGIRIESSATSNVVENSVVTGQDNAIHLDGADGNTVRNNFFYGGTNYGIWVQNSKDSKVYFNSVRSDPAGKPGNLIRFSPSTGDTGSDFKNNNLFLDSTGSGEYCFFVSSTSESWTGDYNNFYIVGSGRVGKYNGVNYDTLSAWQGAGHGQDGNSIASDPRSISAPNQRLADGVGLGANPMVGAGVAIHLRELPRRGVDAR